MTDTPEAYPQTYPETQPIPYQYELAVLGEECGEVIQITGKIMRFGIESSSPLDPERRTNHELLHEEVGDILAAIDFATERGLLDKETLTNRAFMKRKKLHLMAPNPVLPITPIATTAKKTHPAIPVATIIILLIIGAVVFMLGRMGGMEAQRERASMAAMACSAKQTPAQCRQLLNLSAEEASANSQSANSN